MNLLGFEMGVAEIVAPFVIVVIVLTTGRFTHDLAYNLVCRMIFRFKGYRIRQVVLLNGKEAVITRIGIWTTDFLMLNGGHRLEFEAVSNTKLDNQKVRALVRKYEDDTGQQPEDGQD